ncbi:MAG: RsmB/NOP family class I SAM-dependent RNA methyltransferase [Candidatus Coproplasma sp.]
MINLPEQFIVRMRALLGSEADEFFASYNSAAQKGIRVNTLKISPEEFARISPFAIAPVPWEPNGFYVDDEKPGKTVLHAAGLYYVQEPSAMCAAPLLHAQAGERVLDLCAAPGGKGTQLAQAMKGEGIIVLNEINFSRAKILSQNVERLGIKNAVVTCAPPERIAERLSGWFDKVLVDAPCSGEGMFKKEKNAIPEWSVDNVMRCADRQSNVLRCAAKALRVGGKMVYSTCTFSFEEDEGQIENFLKENNNFTLISQEKLYPHRVRGEGHYAALMTKDGGEERDTVSLAQPKTDKKALALYRAFEQENLIVRFENIQSVGSNLYSLPEGMPETGLQTLRAGVHLGEIKGDRFEPSHSLAACLKKDQAYAVEVDETTALKYLAGNTFECSENYKGWRIVTYLGYPLGWCKCVNGVAKNHLPKGIRI